MKKMIFNLVVFLGLIIVNPSFADRKLTAVTKQCGETEIKLVCTKLGDRGCEASKLSFQSKGMPENIIKLPKEIKASNFSAVGLSCTENPNGEQYVIVQFGELPYGCEICEFYYLYDLKGNALTKSDPLLLKEQVVEGDSRKSLTPNNREFNEMSKKLNIKFKEVETL